MATKKSKKKRPLKNTQNAKKKPIKKTAKKVKASAKKKAGPAKKKTTTKKAKAKPAKKTASKKKTATKKTIVKKSAKAPVKKSSAKPGAKKASAVKSTARATPAPRKPTVAVNWEEFFSPLEDRILVEEINTEAQTASGLWIPQPPKDHREGIVRSVGPGARNSAGQRRPLDLKLGDKVLLRKYGGQPLRLMDQPFLIVRESELIGIVE